MYKIKKIMIAIDLSERSIPAREFASDLAEKLNARLIIVNVINQVEIRGLQKITKNSDTMSIEQYLKDEEKSRHDQIVEIVNANIPHEGVKEYIKIIIRHGVPFQEILEVAKEEAVDLIVMGTKGRSNLTNVLIGSTARYLFYHSKIPLLTIPLKTVGRL